MSGNSVAAERMLRKKMRKACAVQFRTARAFLDLSGFQFIGAVFIGAYGGEDVLIRQLFQIFPCARGLQAQIGRNFRRFCAAVLREKIDDELFFHARGGGFLFRRGSR